MSLQKKGRGLLAGIGAAATAVLLALGGGAAAQAAPIIPPSFEHGNLHIHKFEQPAAPGQPADGLPRDTAGLTPIGEVTFTVQRIKHVDLSTNAGWVAAAGISYDAATGTISGEGSDGQPAVIGDVDPANGTQTTDAAGDATFSGLPIGLYLVTETAAPAGVTPSAPFLVTVPLTNPETRTDWMQDVHVYPKNSTSTATKTVDDAAAVKVGDDIAWTIRGDIPKTADPAYDSAAPIGAGNQPFLAPSGYRVSDTLDQRLAYVSAEVTLTEGGGALVPADYTVVVPSAENGNTFSVTFTAAGLAKLGAAAGVAGSQVQVVLTTTVTSLGDGTVGDGVITNRAVVFPNRPSIEGDPGNPPTETPEVESRWGDILIHKVDARNRTVALPGAEFQVFASKEDADRLANPISVNGTTTFTTGDDGTVRISGLRYSDFVDGAQLADDQDPKWRYYWVVETRAPEVDGQRYELLAEPVRVTVDAAQQVISGDVENPAAGETVIENVPHNAGFELPLTGAAGTWMFTIGGLLVLGGGLALALRRRKTGA
ncbi:SpaH/EbpB family LPXTG-anchored major pilin [Leucobacter sp. CSA1]|uniref:SpaH/EbpB family LPXTG-anchored major pilin n=1 Tax=Leucobacter chromiisoli TaxID=2796471 RepID=A0A934QBN7_9MICO|nr:SpaH/EbpB family LPXTG-anchored major pilin [Leucobacter chromiisoli]MBK0420127.1 SpaH/EbpB family LPXTG-anchored major pilin [Leucobacter chromiisoli]